MNHSFDRILGLCIFCGMPETIYFEHSTECTPSVAGAASVKQRRNEQYDRCRWVLRRIR